MSIKLIASDLDGTIANANNEITETNFEALKKIANKNIYFAISTGKPYAISKKFCDTCNASFGIFGNGTQVIDLKNKKEIAIVDASTEAHMLDLLIYRAPAKIAEKPGKNEYIIAGRSCLAGDVFGTYKLFSKLKVGSTVRFADAAGYTMVKKNWFNGVRMPSIVVKRLNGKIELVRKFGYNDFIKNLS